MKPFLLVLLLTTGLLAGCASSGSFVPYKNTASNNVTVNTQISSGDDMAIYLSIHRMLRQCQEEYQGSLLLKPGKLQFGLPTGQLTYVGVIINSSSFRGTSTIERGTFIPVKKNERYEIVVNYVDDMFDLRFLSKSKHGTKEFDLISIDACRS